MVTALERANFRFHTHLIEQVIDPDTGEPFEPGGDGSGSLSATNGGGYVVNTIAASGATETIDPADGSIVDITLTDDCTITLADPANGVGCELRFILRQGSGAPHVPTFSPAPVYEGGSPPTWATDEDDFNIVDLLTIDGGTTWIAANPNVGGGAADSGYSTMILAEPDLVQYWQMNDAPGSGVFVDSMGGTSLTASTDVGFGGPSLTGDAMGGSAVAAWGATNNALRSAITWPAAWSIELWAVMGGEASNSWMFGQWNGNGAMVYGNADGGLYIYSGGTNTGWAGGINACRGLHHLVMTHDGSTQKLWVDGVERVSQNIASPGTNVGGSFGLGLASGSWAAAVSDLALYDVALDSTTINAHYDLGIGA